MPSPTTLITSRQVDSSILSNKTLILAGFRFYGGRLQYSSLDRASVWVPAAYTRLQVDDTTGELRLN